MASGCLLPGRSAQMYARRNSRADIGNYRHLQRCCCSGSDWWRHRLQPGAPYRYSLVHHHCDCLHNDPRPDIPPTAAESSCPQTSLAWQPMGPTTPRRPMRFSAIPSASPRRQHHRSVPLRTWGGSRLCVHDLVNGVLAGFGAAMIIEASPTIERIGHSSISCRISARICSRPYLVSDEVMISSGCAARALGDAVARSWHAPRRGSRLGRLVGLGACTIW